MTIRRFTIAVLACALIVSCVSCGFGSGTPEPQTPITNYEAEQAVVAYLQSEANTSHGEDLLAEFLSLWHNKGDYQDNQGNWVIRAGVYETEVGNSSLLSTVLSRPQKGVCMIEWRVSHDGSLVYAYNSNAEQLDAALRGE